MSTIINAVIMSNPDGFGVTLFQRCSEGHNEQRFYAGREFVPAKPVKCWTCWNRAQLEGC